jgi:hypothetical protein
METGVTDSLAAAPRRLWLRHAIVGPADGVNQRAVAAVLAGYLADRGERPDSLDLPRRLKDRVNRALSGSSLSAETLRWFIEAFELDPDQESALFQAWLGSGDTDHGAVDDQLEDGVDDDGHRTLHLQEWHRLGPDGIPSVHETVQTIQATGETLEGYLYRFDRKEVVVDGLHGGRAGPVHQVDEGLHGVWITFPTPLSKGDTATLRYRTRFAFESPPPPRFRRASRRRIDQVLVIVEFHPARMPRRVRWCQWDGYGPDAAVVAEEDVTVGRTHDVHRVVSPVPDRPSPRGSWISAGRSCVGASR